jgi:hypothetical protein
MHGAEGGHVFETVCLCFSGKINKFGTSFGKLEKTSNIPILSYYRPSSTEKNKHYRDFQKRGKAAQ